MLSVFEVERTLLSRERKATMKDVVAGLARVQGPYCATSRSLITQATGHLKAVLQTLRVKKVLASELSRSRSEHAYAFQFVVKH